MAEKVEFYILHLIITDSMEGGGCFKWYCDEYSNQQHVS